MPVSRCIHAFIHVPPTIPTVIFLLKACIKFIMSSVISPRGIVNVPSTSNKAMMRGFSGLLILSFKFRLRGVVKLWLVVRRLEKKRQCCSSISWWWGWNDKQCFVTDDNSAMPIIQDSSNNLSWTSTRWWQQYMIVTTNRAMTSLTLA